MLTELSTGGSEPLTVRVNTLTTVVVINYVEPEGEQPAAIDVVKYTCAPGFQGRVWLDFAEACLDDANRTNNVGFRLSGAVSARRVTGDTGIGGATRFDGLPSGDYQLREEARWAPSRSTPSVASILRPTGAEWATRSICVSPPARPSLVTGSTCRRTSPGIPGQLRSTSTPVR